MVPVQYYFILSALLFFIGVYGFISRRNLIAMLISVELILNAVEINFAAFNRLLFPVSSRASSCLSSALVWLRQKRLLLLRL